MMLMLQYKYKVLLHKEQKKASVPREDMAPHSATFSSFDHLHDGDKDKIKLRKPIVEKMRRDRINSCIDQLKALLEKELHSHDPSTKLEKADILELTVSFLKQRQRQLPQKDFNEGYSHCWRESVHFLSLHSKDEGSGQHLHTAQKSDSSIGFRGAPSSSKLETFQQPGSRTPVVWRPW
ncbi:hypothetical protein DNTS_009142 [Danionella cerebrum]|uniref:Transcription factor HES-5 n=1 Tax=Danionella cerebrum TaxID=2873325 RepID=A0A553QAU1_9TELE|nr:hypothetical protein DNTS_009142 [Danionella translucida]